MDIAESIKKKTGFKKQVSNGKGLEGLEIIDIRKMNEQETKQCVDSLWNKIIKNNDPTFTKNDQ